MSIQYHLKIQFRITGSLFIDYPKNFIQNREERQILDLSNQKQFARADMIALY